MTQFSKTKMGHQFYEVTMPELVGELRRLADGIHALALKQPASSVDHTEDIPASSRTRVLIVDDQDIVLRGIQRALKTQCDVVVSNSIVGALKLLASEPFDAIVTDFALQESVTGADLLAEVRLHWPNMRRVLTSGRASKEMEKYVDEGIAHQFLPKPVGKDDLLNAIEG